MKVIEAYSFDEIVELVSKKPLDSATVVIQAKFNHCNLPADVLDELMGENAEFGKNRTLRADLSG